MPAVQPQPVFPTARRVSRFTYAIRNIVAEAQKAEAAGVRVRYLNIGDPIQFGFRTPDHLVEAVIKAIRDGHQEYGSSAGLPEAREAVAQTYTAGGFPIAPDRVLITSGTSEGIELVLNAAVDDDGEVLVPMPTYPLYTAVLARLGARARYYRLDPAAGWMPDLEHLSTLVGPATRAIVVIDPNNPTGACYPEPVRRALIDFAERHRLILLADEVYGDLAYAGEIPFIGSLAPDAAIVSFSSLSKAYLAPGWRTGWLAVGRTARLDPLMTAIRKLADARLCTAVPMQYAIRPALLGDRSHQTAFRHALRERAELTTAALSAVPGLSCVPPSGAFYVMPRLALPPGRTDEDFVLALLRRTGILCVHGSGFGLPADQGFFRIVFLADPDELRTIYGLLAGFAAEYASGR